MRELGNIPSFIVKDYALIFDQIFKLSSCPSIQNQAKVYPVLEKLIVHKFLIIDQFFASILYKCFNLNVSSFASTSQHGRQCRRKRVWLFFHNVYAKVEMISAKLILFIWIFKSSLTKLTFPCLLINYINMAFHLLCLFFLRYYLQGCEQVVTNHNTKSNTFTSGVPQESNLGRLLFLLFIFICK